MLLNTVLNSATTRQFRDTIFKILIVRQYQSINIRFIECYLVPDHQEVVRYMQPYIHYANFYNRSTDEYANHSICTTLLASGRIIFKILHVRQARIFLISSKYRLNRFNWSCHIPDNFAIVLFRFGSIILQSSVTTISLPLRIRASLKLRCHN